MEDHVGIKRKADVEWMDGGLEGGRIGGEDERVKEYLLYDG